EDRPEPRPVATGGPTGPASPPPGRQGAGDADDFDIHPRLPFSPQEFAPAPDLAQRFVSAYGTYPHDAPPQTYTRRLSDLAAARLSGFVTDELEGQLARDAGTPGLLEERRRDEVVAEGTATLDQVRNIEDNSVVFVVTGIQKVTRRGEESSDRRKYAVTVARDGGSLKVYAFQPADVGQAGDTG